MTLSISVILDKLCFSTIVVLMCWISILKPFSILSNIAILLLFVYHIYLQKQKIGNTFSIIFLSIIAFSSYSLIIGQSLSGVVRFTLILLFLCLAPFIKLKIGPIAKIIFYCSCPFVIFIICFELWMVLFTDATTAGLIRRFIIETGMGDVYTFGGLYRIQLSGTGCLLAFYMLSYVTNMFPQKHLMLYRLLYVASIIFAGNFAFILGLVVFHFLYAAIQKIKKKKLLNYSIVTILLLLLISPYAVSYLTNTIEQKSAESNAERIFQTEALMSDLSSSLGSLLFGRGLGNIVEIKGVFRDYSVQGDYYELQSLYFMNQMGLIFFCLFLVFNIWVTVCKIPTAKGRIAYISYVSYGFFNPYILNTLHVVVLLVLCNLSKSNSLKIPNYTNGTCLPVKALA